MSRINEHLFDIDLRDSVVSPTRVLFDSVSQTSTTQETTTVGDGVEHDKESKEKIASIVDDKSSNTIYVSDCISHQRSSCVY